MLKTGILTIGDEILIGQIENTNARHIAELVTSCGCKVVNMLTVGDTEEAIINALQCMSAKCRLVIITGGLGPTHDDITKRILCEYTHDTIVTNEEWLRHLEEKFKSRGIPMNDLNRTQAEVPGRAKVLFNRLGTAPGMLIDYRGTTMISLPGVPQEMLAIMRDAALEEILNLAKKTGGETILYRNIRTAGIAESVLAEMLQEVNPDFLGRSSLAYLPNFAGVKLRIGAYGESHQDSLSEMERISSKIMPIIEKYVISLDEKPFAETLGVLLKNQKKTLSVAESCTGGMLGAEITSIPGASEYFKGGIISYSNEIKINNLSIPANTIDTFGAVSGETAEAMALSALRKFNSDYALSITGIAGPDGGTIEKPLGTVWFGLADSSGAVSFTVNCGTQRAAVRERAVQTAMVALIKRLRGQD